MRKQQKEKVPLSLRKETLRQLDETRLEAVWGGGRLRVPVGYADNTDPIYDDAP
jgi:hypothetical protein